VVSAIRKSSTNNWRPTSIGITGGGVTRYDGVASSFDKSTFPGGHFAGRRMPL
jgi:hypothetical protein